MIRFVQVCIVAIKLSCLSRIREPLSLAVRCLIKNVVTEGHFSSFHFFKLDVYFF